jgi:fatty-acid peroxygenase
MPRLENGLQLLTKGYGWLPDKRRAASRRTVTARLGGLPVTAIEGPDAARFLYDEDHVRRAHAIPAHGRPSWAERWT